MRDELSSFGLHNVPNDKSLLSDDDSSEWMCAGDVKNRVSFWKAKLDYPRTLVFSFIENTVEGVAQLLGATEAGHPVALLDPNLPKDSKAELIRIYQPGLVLERDSIQHNPAGTTDIHPDLFILLSTSGSTGSPKFVRLTAANLISNAKSIAHALSIEPTEVGCAHLPLHYSYGLSIITSHLIRGAPIHLTEHGFLDTKFWPQMRKWKIAHLPGVPFHYQTLRRLKFENMDLPELRVMTQAGGALDLRIKKMAHEFMESLGGRFYVMYGQTEASPRITTLSHDDFGNHSDTVGAVLMDGKIEVLDPAGDPLPSGSDGDVVYHGPNVMMGYAENATDLALGDINQGRLVTGDIGRLDQQQRLTVSGRSKRVGKVAGLRVNLDEVQRLLVAELGEIAVVQKGANLIIYHSPVDDEDQLRQQALALLLSRFSLPQVAYRFQVIDSIPRTVRGKIDYAALC